MTTRFSRRYFARIAVRTVAGVLLMAFLICLYSVLLVRSAVAQGAVETPGFGCIDPPHLTKRAELVDRSFVRSVAAFEGSGGQPSMGWHANQGLAYIGSQLGYSRAEREALVLPGLLALPACARRNQPSHRALTPHDR